jgi:hypothetical protein
MKIEQCIAIRCCGRGERGKRCELRALPGCEFCWTHRAALEHELNGHRISPLRTIRGLVRQKVKVER